MDGAIGCCLTCQRPISAGYLRCYQCAQHQRAASGLLADAVVPIGYAISGGRLANDLWRYKAAPPDRAAAARVRALLLGFLREHGPCVWRAAGMARPQAVAFVPSGRGRAGEHPLRRLVLPFLRLREVPLRVRQEYAERGRGLEPGWLAAGQPGGDVLVIDDTWVSGASAQSAAVAVKLAGASRVAIVVLGRHIDPADPVLGRLGQGDALTERMPCPAHAAQTGEIAH